ncbi:MAG TPA: serine/threonine-protein kinase [Gemmatimonadaceae bacterium]|nr:serine/threonine-protein kinase [Gemmatimonadaceae bacterium]
MSHSVAGELELARNALADEYEVLDEIGRGGMAIVFRARDKALDRDVAIKVLPPAMAFDAAFVERFQHEARTAAQLEHPNIVPIYRVGQAGAGPSQVIYIVMKQLRGESLAEQLAARGTLPPDEIRAMLRDTVQALSYASRRGVVHRDIKPDNILYDENRWVLADFGIAKSLNGRSLTQSGAAVGTPRYMSPEQARAKPLDVRADIYSLGIVAYQCLVGHVPFDGEDGFAILYDHVTAPLPTPPLANDDERALFAIIGRMTEKHTDDRVQDGDALLRLLDVPPRPTPTMTGIVPLVDVSVPTNPTALRTIAEGPTVPIITSPVGLQAISDGPTMPLPPEAVGADTATSPAGRRSWRRWTRWAIEAAILATGLLVLLGRSHRPVPALPVVAPAATTAPPKDTATPTPAPAPAVPVPPVAKATGKSRCGSAFRLLINPIATPRYRDTPFDFSYDVCGLAANAPYKLVVTTRRQTSGIGKLLGGAGAVTETLDERATGPLSHLKIRFSSFAELKPGDYVMVVTVSDKRRRIRTRTETFQVLDRRN